MHTTTRGGSKPPRHMSTGTGNKNRTVPKMRIDKVGAGAAAMLMAPRSAILSHPVYTGAGGGIMVRCMSDYIFIPGAAITAGAISFTPSCVGYSVYATSGLDTAVTNFVKTDGPGEVAKLSSMYESVRCAGASIEVKYGGTELNRSGYVGALRTTATTIRPLLTANTQTVGAIYTSCQTDDKMPDAELEYTWMPTASDGFYKALGAGLTQPPEGAVDGSDGCLVVCHKGIQPNTAVTYRLTAIYECIPKVNTGQMIEPMRPLDTTSTLDSVLGYVRDYAGAFANVAMVVGSSYATYKFGQVAQPLLGRV